MKMSVSLSVETSEMIESLIKESGRSIVVELSKKYGFSVNEGLFHLNLEGKKVVVNEESDRVGQSKIPIPFCGVKCETNCNGIRLNHGLYTQCTNVGMVEGLTGENELLCKTCSKQQDKNSNKKPTYGYIDERIELGDRFRDPKGKEPVLYGNIMEKLNISREDAEKEAAKQGLTIPEKQFEIKKAQRGRPKKDTIAIDTSGSEDEPQKKSRGRPKKNKQVVSANAGENLIKDLVNKAQIGGAIGGDPLTPHNLVPTASGIASNPTASELSVETSSDNAYASSDDEDEEELAVTEFKISGKKYLKSADNTLYDFNTHEEIGTWNPKTKEISDETL